MIKILFFILLSFTILAKEKVVIYADENYPPYTYVENGKLTGIYIDLLKGVNKKLIDFDIIIEPIPWTRAVKMIETGQAEAIIDAWYRPIERPFMSYSVPMLDEEIIVVSIKEDGGTWPKDYVGKKIGINRGFAVFKEADKKVLTIEEANSTGDNIMKLLTGRINYYANDKYSIFWELSNMVKTKKIKASDAKRIKEVQFLSKEQGYIGYRKVSDWKNKEKFVKIVDEEIVKMQKNGELDIIIKKYRGN